MSEEHPAETEIDIKGVDSDHPLRPAILLQLDCFRVGKWESDILGEAEKKGKEGEWKGDVNQFFPVFIHSLT